MRIYKHLIFPLLCALVAFASVAQNSMMSPYSKYGYGLLNDNATSMQRSMGGVGYAMNSGRQINVMNPASYAAIDSLTFLWDVGLSLTNLWSKEKGGSATSTGGGLDYITMQFPLGKYMGGSIGLLPYSSVGYSFGNEIMHGTTSHSGYGGLNQLYAGVSGRPFKNFTIGANFYYLWGNLVNDIYAFEQSGTTSLFERVMDVKDWNVTIGAQYNIKFNQKHKATLGLTFAPGKALHGNTWGVYYDINNDTKPDTVGYKSLGGNYTIPATWGAGISYTYNDKLTTEVDFTYQNWKDAKYSSIESFESTTFDTRWKVNAGVQYQINPRGSYAQRMFLRAGSYYNHDYISIDNNGLREYGVSVGVGLPAIGSKTLINIGFEYKRRETSPARLVTEDYFNITLGINFNEMWFWQNKIR